MNYRFLRLISLLLLFSLLLGTLLTACGPAEDEFGSDQGPVVEEDGGDAQAEEPADEPAAEPTTQPTGGLSEEPASSDDFPVYPGAEILEMGQYPEVDEYVDQMEGLPVDTATLQLYSLPSETDWAAVRDFYSEQVSNNGWEEQPDYAWDEEDRGAVAWNDGDALVLATFEPEGPDFPFLIIQTSASGEQAGGSDTGGGEASGNDTGGGGTSGSDAGFAPATDGFSFENYGDDIPVVNLTPAEMQRMFGDKVCASMAGGECILTPIAEEWMMNINQGMSGGHCEGMAVLSSLFYYQKENPGNFGGDVTAELALDDNEALQREIAYWFSTQYTYPGSATKINETPAAVVDTLAKAFAEGKNVSEMWVVGIYQPDFSGGHAVTPIGVEDLGGSKYTIQVYDNNFPGEVRNIEVDTDANTWSYMASTNPNEPEALYEGDASTQTLEVVAVSPRMAQQECDFCMGGGAGSRSGSGLGANDQQYYEISLVGLGNLLIEDENGQRIGLVDGKFVNEISGASRNPVKLGVNVWGQDYEPVYRVPVGRSFDITVDPGSAKEPITASISMIGPGYFVSVDEIWLEPGTADTIKITVDGSRHQLTYITDYSESPVVMMGIETDQADYAFMVQATELVGAEDNFLVAVDLATGEFILNTSDNQEASSYDFYVLRIDDAGLSAFGTAGFSMDPDTTVFLQYAAWTDNGAPMLAEIDYGNDGQIDETKELPDTSDEFIWE